MGEFERGGLLDARRKHVNLVSLAFLFEPYRPEWYFMECFEMFRRTLFVGALPLFSQSHYVCASVGVLLSLMSVIVYRELEPFERSENNVLNYASQYGLALTYMAALVILTGLGDALNSLAFGLALVAANVPVVAVAAGLGVHRHRESRHRP